LASNLKTDVIEVCANSVPKTGYKAGKTIVYWTGEGDLLTFLVTPTLSSENSTLPAFPQIASLPQGQNASKWYSGDFAMESEWKQEVIDF
jgi:hypothetical protein